MKQQCTLKQNGDKNASMHTEKAHAIHLIISTTIQVTTTHALDLLDGRVIAVSSSLDTVPRQQVCREVHKSSGRWLL